MLSLCYSQSYELCSPFALTTGPPKRVHFALVYFISWLNFLKFVRFCSHVTQECKHIQPHKRWVDGTNEQLSVQIMTKGLRYSQKIITTQAGTMKQGVS